MLIRSRRHLCSRTEEANKSRVSTMALKDQLAVAEDLAAEAQAEAERLETELRTGAADTRASDTPPRPTALAARTARRAPRAAGETPAPAKTPRDRRRKDR